MISNGDIGHLCHTSTIGFVNLNHAYALLIKHSRKVNLKSYKIMHYYFSVCD